MVAKNEENKQASNAELEAAKIVDSIRDDMRKALKNLAKVDISLNAKNHPLYLSCLNLQTTICKLDAELEGFGALVNKNPGEENG